MVGKKTGNKAVGRTKGGLNTKIHAIVDGLGNPVVFLLSPGNDNDSTHAIELMSMTDIAGSNLLGDKAYGTKEILTYIKEHRAAVVIPPKSNAKEPWEIDYFLYKERHLVECFTGTTLIISKKPGNTGISRDIRTEFTTDLLLSD